MDGNIKQFVEDPEDISQVIKDTQQRLKEKFQDAALPPIVSCDEQSAQHQSSYGGKCSQCNNEEHTIRPTKAALMLAEELKSECKKLPPSMIGVLLCKDPKTGKIKTLIAASGDETEITADLEFCKTREVILCESLEKKLEDELNEKYKLKIEKLESERKTVMAQLTYYKKTIKEIEMWNQGKPSKAIESTLTELDPLVKGVVLDQRCEDLKKKLPAVEAKNEQLRKQLKDLITKKELAMKNRRQINNQPVSGFINQSLGVKTSTGQIGACAAPKLVAKAQQLGLEPLSIAEFWNGDDKEHYKKHEYVQSCKYCRSILGKVLCKK